MHFRGPDYNAVRSLVIWTLVDAAVFSTLGFAMGMWCFGCRPRVLYAQPTPAIIAGAASYVPAEPAPVLERPVEELPVPHSVADDEPPEPHVEAKARLIPSGHLGPEQSRLKKAEN
jgi:hypothetical protein